MASSCADGKNVFDVVVVRKFKRLHLSDGNVVGRIDGAASQSQLDTLAEKK